jgi:mortality factor 4-like protein 1
MESKQVPSDIYSGEHLLRLFVKLPELLAHSRLTEKEALVLQAKLGEFLKWLEKKPEYFATDYHVPDDNYKKEVEA